MSMNTPVYSPKPGTYSNTSFTDTQQTPMTLPHHHRNNKHNQEETILVTGGAGFIGSHTVVQLLNLGKHLVIVDNLCNSFEESLHRAQALADNPTGSLVFHKVDLLDGVALEAVFQLYTFSACIHFAGLKAVGESSQIPLGYYQTNITGTLNLVQLLQKYNCRSLIFSSSATVYGLPTSDAPLKEDAPTGAMNPYGRTKLYIEQILRDTSESEPGRWNIILLRYFNPVGAHESGRIGEDPNGTPNNLMPYVAQVAIGRRPIINIFGNDYNTKDGTGVRDYIHIQDLARGHVFALAKIEAVLRSDKPLGCTPYNLGTGSGYSVMEMIHSMGKAVGHELPFKVIGRRLGDVATVIADPGLAAKELGWKAEKTLEDMCEDLWRWQTMNPEGFSSSSSSSTEESSTTAAPTTHAPHAITLLTIPGKHTTTTTTVVDGRSTPPFPLSAAFSPVNSPAPEPAPRKTGRTAI